MIIDSGKRLANSKLWEVQEGYYDSKNIDAWDTVPYYPTSNPRIAKAYADLVIAFLFDSEASLDFSQPFYILELAAGTGAFSFHFLNAFSRRLARFSRFSDLDWCYIVSDFSDAIVTPISQKPEFRPFVEKGCIDFTVYRPEEECEIRLRDHNRTLSESHFANPLVAFSNYLFDTIRHDFFRVKHGKLHEGIVKLHQDLQSEEVTFDVEYRPVTGEHYPEDELFEKVLRSYEGSEETLSGIFPLGALRVVKNLARLSAGNMMLVSTDKGFSNTSYMHGETRHVLSGHGGCYSLMVNYDALNKYVDLLGGQTWCTSAHFSQTKTMVNVLSSLGSSFEHVIDCFEESFLQSHLHMAVAISYRFASKRFHQHSDRVAKACLALISVSNFDPYVFYECASEHYHSLVKAEDRLQCDLYDAIRRTRDNMYNAPGQPDVFYWFGYLLLKMKKPKEALEDFQRSFSEHGRRHLSVFYAGRCSEELHNLGQARVFFEEALKLSPNCEATKAAVERVR